MRQGGNVDDDMETQKESQFCYRIKFKEEMIRDDAGETGRYQITETFNDVIFRYLEIMLLWGSSL